MTDDTVEPKLRGSGRPLLEQKKGEFYSFLLRGYRELVTTSLFKQGEECIPKSRQPRTASTIPTLLSYRNGFVDKHFCPFKLGSQSSWASCCVHEALLNADKLWSSHHHGLEITKRPSCIILCVELHRVW